MTLHGALGEIYYAAMPITDNDSCLTQSQLADVDSLTLPKRRAERITVYCLINRYIAAGMLLSHYPDGAPYLVGDGVPRTFSLSHCREGVAIAWSFADILLGIDIETNNPKLARIAPRFVAPGDLTLPADAQTYLTLWTIKEAVYKALRTPALSLTDIVVTPSLEADNAHLVTTPVASIAAYTIPFTSDTLIALAF